MDKIVTKINLIWGGVCTVLAGIFGQYWFLFLAFLVMNVIDYISGIIKAKMFKVENSCQGMKGIVKKVGYWIVISIAFFISLVFEKFGAKIGADLSFTVFFGWFTLATFIVNEIRSIFENLVIMGVKVPKFLTYGLEAAEDFIDKNTNHNVKKGDKNES